MNSRIDKGFICISRQIIDSEIWLKPPEWFKIFIYILLKVNHKNTKLFPRGSNRFNFSEQRPEGVSLNQVYEFLRWAKGENVKILTTQKTTRGTVININNYDKFQTIDNYYNQDTNQDPTKTQPRPNQDPTKMINKNERMKECKNNNSIVGKKTKRKNLKIFTPPTLKDIQTYCKERNNNVDARKFFDYYSVSNWKDSSGKPLKNWKQKIIAVWETKESESVPSAQKSGKYDRLYKKV